VYPMSQRLYNEARSFFVVKMALGGPINHFLIGVSNTRKLSAVAS
jgi:hypothetical protein